MKRQRLTTLFALAALIAVIGSTACAQTQTVSPKDSQAQASGQNKEAATQAAAVEQVLSKEEQEMVADSKSAIIGTGISEPYFKEHFRLDKVVNEAGDRRVEWKYSVNEYETSLVDDVGYYTSPTGKRIDVHSIQNELFSAYDIKQTIPRSKADAALQSCIGEHRDTQVVYRALKAPGKAGLYLTARSTAMPEDEKDKDKETGREVEGVSFKIGLVDLESGKCTVEWGQVTP
jgi:hypothetical protein